MASCLTETSASVESRWIAAAIAGALAPALEAQLRLRREQPRQRARGGPDLARQRVDVVQPRWDRRARSSAARRQRGSRGSGTKVAESSAWCNSSMTRRTSSSVRSSVLRASNSARIAWLSSGDTRTTNSRSGPHSAARCFSQDRSKYSVRISMSASRSMACSSLGRHPDGAVRRHQPASLGRRHLHRAPGRIDQLRLAVQMRIDPHALGIVARNQVDARRASDGCPDLPAGLALQQDSHWQASRHGPGHITHFASRMRIWK